MRYSSEANGGRLDPGEPRGYAENAANAADGALGWVVDQPTVPLPDGRAISPRVTALRLREEGAGRLVHAHFSVLGIPERRWSRATNGG